MIACGRQTTTVFHSSFCLSKDYAKLVHFEVKPEFDDVLIRDVAVVDIPDCFTFRSMGVAKICGAIAGDALILTLMVVYPSNHLINVLLHTWP
jgi:hypothetical protein